MAPRADISQKMVGPDSYRRLVELLRELGVRTVEDRSSGPAAGFPLSVPLEGGGELVLDLPSPAWISNLDPEGIGVAILDPFGYTRTLWGLARKLPHFRPGSCLLDSPLAGLLEGGVEGSHGALYLDGFRYFGSVLPHQEGADVLVLVVDAREERQAKRQASKSWRMANALKRLGKALTMNQNRAPICVACAHEIASAAELAAVLIWTHDPVEGALELAASVGANRLGTSTLALLSAQGANAGCAAELVAATRHPFALASVADHILTSDLEAKFCYLKPKGLSVHPLVSADRLLGVVEFVGRDGDPHFAENAELFETIAEHVALALSGAVLFEEFERLASHDALTGLANHRAMQSFLQQRLHEAERTGQTLGLVMIDVDHYRSFNEEEGHDAGDDVLKLVAAALKSCLRPYDLAARYGGEEFTLVMPGGGREGTSAVAERIRRTVEATSYSTRSGRDVHVTVSLGCALYPETATDAPSLLKAADVALFDAKRLGRNRVVFSTGAPATATRPAALSPETLRPWMHALDWEEAEARLGRLAREIDWLEAALRLSPSQRAILEALVRFAPTYRRAAREGDRTMLNAVCADPAFRLLAPSLARLGERFDGQGERAMGDAQIPLLARVLEVLLALEEDGGEALVRDSGRFDPEILALLEECQRAA